MFLLMYLVSENLSCQYFQNQILAIASFITAGYAIILEHIWTYDSMYLSQPQILWRIAEIWRFLTLIIRNTYPEVAFMSTSGQDGLRRQNIRGGRSLDPPLRRKEPTRLGDVAPLPVAGCTVSPGEEVHSKVRLRAERECVCDDVTVPGGGTT
jgi:hypothetical protein